jgi:hypothetical protein
MTIYEISFLTQGGRELWSEEDGVSLTDILGPNDLHPCFSYTYKDITFCHIKESELNMEEYYHWKDTVATPEKDLFCWRSFYLFVSPAPAPAPAPPTTSAMPTMPTMPRLWLPIPDTEHLAPYSCQELLTTWLTLHHTS